jgi:hypothetical protein
MAKNAIIYPNGQLIDPAPHDPARDLWDESADIAMRATGRPADSLSQREKFAVCVVAGASLHYVKRDGHQPSLETVHACNVQRVGARWKVTQVTPPPTLPPIASGRGASPQIPPETVE